MFQLEMGLTLLARTTRKETINGKKTKNNGNNEI
jgi:hypothetical protein